MDLFYFTYTTCNLWLTENDEDFSVEEDEEEKDNFITGETSKDEHLHGNCLNIRYRFFKAVIWHQKIRQAFKALISKSFSGFEIVW
jgi:hypothetical protein